MVLQPLKAWPQVINTAIVKCWCDLCATEKCYSDARMLFKKFTQSVFESIFQFIPHFNHGHLVPVKYIATSFLQAITRLFKVKIC